MYSPAEFIVMSNQKVRIFFSKNRGYFFTDTMINFDFVYSKYIQLIIELSIYFFIMFC